MIIQIAFDFILVFVISFLIAAALDNSNAQGVRFWTLLALMLSVDLVGALDDAERLSHVDDTPYWLIVMASFVGALVVSAIAIVAWKLYDKLRARRSST